MNKFNYSTENKEDEEPKIIKDGPIPWCRNDQLTFISEQVSHHPPSKIQTISCIQLFLNVSYYLFSFCLLR